MAILARWSSDDAVLRYVREAPLDNIADEVKALEGKRDLLRHTKMLCDGAEALDTKMGSLEAQLKQLVVDKDKQFQLWLARAWVSPLPFVSNAALRMPKLHKVLVTGGRCRRVTVLVAHTVWQTIRLLAIHEACRLQRCARRAEVQELLQARCKLLLVLL